MLCCPFILVPLQQIVFVGLTSGCQTLIHDDFIDDLIIVPSVLFSSQAFLGNAWYIICPVKQNDVNIFP